MTATRIRASFFNEFPKHALQPHTVGHRADSVNGLLNPALPDLGPCYGIGAGETEWAAGGLFMETLHSTVIMSPVGPLFLAGSSRALVALEFDRRLPGQQSIRPNPRDLQAESKDVRFEESASEMRSYVRELEEYFAGTRREFTFALDLRGTDFQKACWRALISIPYGETRSYGDIARAVGRPQGFRAVGMANNRNPIAIVVPCHRVIASDGTLCGYGGGLDVKRKLLELEGALSGTLAA
jgi:O-6-methylguanine DNA methyltransferase